MYTLSYLYMKIYPSGFNFTLQLLYIVLKEIAIMTEMLKRINIATTILNRLLQKLTIRSSEIWP